MKTNTLAAIPRGFQTLFSSTTKPDLDDFFQITSSLEGSPHFYLQAGKELCYRGRGNFGLLLYRKPVLDFELFLRFKVPMAAKRANSGIFFRVPDISQPLSAYPADVSAKIKADLSRWSEGHLSEAPGTPAIHAAYEVQLEYGYEDYPDWRRNGCLYDISEGVKCGEQQLKPFRLELGNTYDALVKAEGAAFSVRMRDATTDVYQQTVSYINLDTYRGSAQGYIAVQAYDTDGKDDLPFEFLEIALKDNGSPQI